MIGYALARSTRGHQYISELFALYGIEARAMTIQHKGLYIIAIQFRNVSSRRENWAELLWVKLCINLWWMPFRLKNQKNLQYAIKNPRMPRPKGKKADVFFRDRNDSGWGIGENVPTRKN